MGILSSQLPCIPKFDGSSLLSVEEQREIIMGSTNGTLTIERINQLLNENSNLPVSPEETKNITRKMKDLVDGLQSLTCCENHLMAGAARTLFTVSKFFYDNMNIVFTDNVSFVYHGKVGIIGLYILVPILATGYNTFLDAIVSYGGTAVLSSPALRTSFSTATPSVECARLFAQAMEGRIKDELYNRLMDAIE